MKKSKLIAYNNQEITKEKLINYSRVPLLIVEIPTKNRKASKK